MRILPLLAAVLTLGACNPSPPPRVDGANPTNAAVVASTVPLRITTTSGTKTFTVEVAVTAQEQEQGLMHRTALHPGHGMLFPFPQPRTASFWMKNTPLPLDLLFMRPDGTISTILHGQPEDLQPLTANEPVSAVLEIGGGEAARLGITAGARIEWGDCRQYPAPPVNPLAFCPATP